MQQTLEQPNTVTLHEVALRNGIKRMELELHASVKEVKTLVVPCPQDTVAREELISLLKSSAPFLAVQTMVGPPT